VIWPRDKQIHYLDPAAALLTLPKRTPSIAALLSRSVLSRIPDPAAPIEVMKFAEPRSYANPEAAARRLVEIANATEACQDGRIHLEPVNYQFLFKDGASPAEYLAGLNFAITRGWLWQHPSKTFVKFTPARADLFA
jgi:hypothetical protein